MTCHHVYNYGATLQAFALQHYLESLGHEVEIIDYRLSTHRRYEWSYIYPEGRLYHLSQKLPFLKWPIRLCRNMNQLITWGRKKSFDNFDSQYLHLTNIKYRTIEELRNNPPKADLYIAGSDQIWNPEFPNGTDLGYYLDFGEKKIKRISYAASFGVSQISIEQEKLILAQLSKFSHLSVREQSGIDILNKIGLVSEKSIDPVFLLNKEEWTKILNLKDDTNRYILVYDFHHEDISMINFVKRLSIEKGLKIVSVNDTDRAKYADIQINNAGPTQFLNLIKNAEYIVSNSFHATAFSIIFNKRFATFPLNTLRNRGRMVELINSVGLGCFFQPYHIEIFENEICWDIINERIKKEIYGSKEYLVQSLNN